MACASKERGPVDALEIQLSAMAATLDHHTVQLRDIDMKLDSLTVTTKTLHAARNARAAVRHRPPNPLILAEREGFEPPDPLRSLRFSRPPP